MSKTEETQHCQPCCHSPGFLARFSASHSPWRNSCHEGRKPKPSRSSWLEASSESAKHPSWCAPWIMENSTKCATTGLRALIMGKASALEAQYAASSHLDAHRKPNPIKCMGKLATCCALARSAQLWRSLRFSTTPHKPSSCAAACSEDWLGGNACKVWFALGLALWSKSCKAHCKSGTAGIVSHSLLNDPVSHLLPDKLHETNR